MYIERLLGTHIRMYTALQVKLTDAYIKPLLLQNICRLILKHRSLTTAADYTPLTHTHKAIYTATPSFFFVLRADLRAVLQAPYSSKIDILISR